MLSIPKEQLDKRHVLVLYAVNCVPRGVPTKTHYQKMMYLVFKSMGVDPKKNTDYRPHHFGPYSDEMDDLRTTLIDAGYLTKNTRERIMISRDAKPLVRNIDLHNPYVSAKINSICNFVCSLTFDELILFIYSDDVLKNEKMIVNSDIKDKIFTKRIKIAIGMVKASKVSVAKGAELADLDVTTFMKYLKR